MGGWSVRRWTDRASSYLLSVFLVALCAAGVHLWAQSQDSVNARLDERLNSLAYRVEKLETSQTYGLGALIANLVAHILQIRGQKGQRRLPDDR